jgi:two-component system sensor histidine kinase QseC
MSGASGRSLRKFLLASLLSAITLLWVISGILIYRDARHEISELFDAELAGAANVLLADADHEFSERKSEHEEDEDDENHLRHRYSQRVYFQIWNAVGQLVMRSGDALSVVPFSTTESGFSTRELNGRRYRVFVVWDKRHRLQIQVAQLLNTREGFSSDIALHLIFPLLFALPLLAFLILWSVNRSLKPLTKIASDVTARDPSYLEALSVAECPIEIRPLLDGINSLLARLKKELEKERRFTADASHELKTPLAALRVQAEVAMSSSQPEERRHALEQIICAVDRTGHLVSQLLTLARLEPDATLDRREMIQLQPLVGEVMRELAPKAIAKNIELTLAESTASCPGNAAMLSILIRNLIDNAIRYTPDSGKVRVSVSSDNDKAILDVQDSGPGIISEHRARVFDRFYRAPGAPSEGSGLGLSIAKRVVELHGGNIELQGPPGLRVLVQLPRSQFHLGQNRRFDVDGDSDVLPLGGM